MIKLLKYLNVALLAMILSVGFIGCSDEPKDEPPVVTGKNNIVINYENARLSDIKYKDGKIYAALQRMDAEWTHVGNSRILEMTSSGEILRDFECGFMNVVQIAIAGDNLYALNMGDPWGSGAKGGVSKINLSSGSVETVFTGSTAEISRIELVSDTEAFVILDAGYGVGATIAKVNLNDFSVSPVSELEHITNATAISYNSETKRLWVGAGSEVYKFVPVGGEVKKVVAQTGMPVYLPMNGANTIKSVGETTVIVESNYEAGSYSVIINDQYSSKGTIDDDPVVDFANGKFYIIENYNNSFVMLNAAGEKIGEQVSFDSFADFNPRSLCTDGNKVFIGSYNHNIIEIF